MNKGINISRKSAINKENWIVGRKGVRVVFGGGGGGWREGVWSRFISISDGSVLLRRRSSKFDDTVNAGLLKLRRPS